MFQKIAKIWSECISVNYDILITIFYTGSKRAFHHFFLYCSRAFGSSNRLQSFISILLTWTTYDNVHSLLSGWTVSHALSHKSVHPSSLELPNSYTDLISVAQQPRSVGSIADYDPLNGNWGTVAQAKSKFHFLSLWRSDGSVSYCGVTLWICTLVLAKVMSEWMIECDSRSSLCSS